MNAALPHVPAALKNRTRHGADATTHVARGSALHGLSPSGAPAWEGGGFMQPHSGAHEMQHIVQTGAPTYFASKGKDPAPGLEAEELALGEAHRGRLAAIRAAR